MKKIFPLLISLFLLSACGTSKKSSSMYGKKDDSALNAQWFLQDESGENVMGLQGKPVTLEFHYDDGNKANGFAGCNQYGTHFTLQGSALSFDNTYASEMACPNLKLEQNYFSNLKEVNNYKIDGNNLYLYKDNLLLLHFKK